MTLDYSVLMSVYYKENPEHLTESIESMLNQTIPTNDFVLVCDGKLTPELMLVLKKYADNPIMNIVYLEKNVGVGEALNIALPYCKNELIARMDSDDISVSDRCEKQLKIFETMDVDVVGASIEEFIDDPDCVMSKRQVPRLHTDITKYAKKRNPVNQVSVMFKKSKAMACGGYQSFYLLEDYYLWLRMIMSGCKFFNMQETLVKVRTTHDMFMRRGGYSYFKSNKMLQKFMLESGFISRYRYIMNVCERFAVQVAMPNKIRKLFYLKALRK